MPAGEIALRIVYDNYPHQEGLETAWGFGCVITGLEKTILFVTHGINEAIFLSDRVIILSARPSRMIQALDVSLPRPRTLEVRTSPEFGRMALKVYNLLEIT